MSFEVASLIISLIAVALQASSQNIGMFTAARFLIGMGVQIAQGCAPLLITELAHPQHRARFTALYNTTWFVGNIIGEIPMPVSLLIL
jgi:MFS family permease